MLAVGLAIAVLIGLHFSGLLARPPVVKTAKVAPTLASRALTTLNASGYVVAQRKAAVASKATGRLAKLYVEEGSRVKTGDVIAELENADLQALIGEAEAALSVAKALLKNAEAELEDASRQHERHTALRDTGAFSEQAFDASQARFRKAVAAERSARFGVEKAEATLRVARVNMEYSLIRAPFDGVILTKNADVGEVVAPFGSATNAKAAVVTMADPESLLVEVDVSESSIEKVQPGGACEIRLDALPKERFAGETHTIVPTADRAKATVLTKVRFTRLDPRILPEMSAKVAFLQRPLGPDEQSPFLGVPSTALRASAQGDAVFVVKAGRAVKAPVTAGRRWGDTVEIKEGLARGDTVIVDSDVKLTSGMRVSVKE
jgi:RND family efflux transporter MFP subunit